MLGVGAEATLDRSPLGSRNNKEERWDPREPDEVGANVAAKTPLTKSKKENITTTIKSNVKAGGLTMNHNQCFKVRSAVKDGTITTNHNQNLRVRSGR